MKNKVFQIDLDNFKSLLGKFYTEDIIKQVEQGLSISKPGKPVIIDDEAEGGITIEVYKDAMDLFDAYKKAGKFRQLQEDGLME